MRHDWPVSSSAHDRRTRRRRYAAAGRRQRPALLASSLLTVATLALIAAWPDRSLGQTITVSVPQISVPLPRVSVEVPLVSVAVPQVDAAISQTTAAVTQSVGQVTAAVGAAVPVVRVDAAQVVASVGTAHGAVVDLDLPDVANGLAGGQIAASTAAAVAAVTDGLGSVQVAASHGSHGLAALVGPGGIAGAVQAHTGAVTVGSGTVLTVDFYGDGLINFAVDGTPASLGNGTRGAAVADGGTITLSAAAASSIVDRAVNASGVIQIQAIAAEDGRVSLVAAAPAADAAAEPNPGRSEAAVLLAEADLRVGGRSGDGEIRYDEPDTAADGGGMRGGWNQNDAGFFGALSGGRGSGKPDGGSPDAEADPTRASAFPIGPLMAAADPEQEEELAEAVAVLAQIDTVLGREELAATDVCQSAGGGGVGLPGCGATESFGAVVSLEPDATAAGCALIAAGGGVRLSCGGGLDALPTLRAPIDLPEPGLDSTMTLQDLMDQWLNEPSAPTDFPTLLGGQLAAAAPVAATVY